MTADALPSSEYSSPIGDDWPRPWASAGVRLVTAYYVLFYALPALGRALFGEKVDTIFYVAPVTAYAVLELIGVYVLFLLFTRLPPIRFFPERVSAGLAELLRAFGATYSKNRLILGLLVLPFSAQFVLSGGSGYRYGDVSISDASIFDQFMILVNLWLAIDMFCQIFVRRVAPPLVSRATLENLVITAALLLTANGTATVLLGLGALAYSLRPSLFQGLAFIDPKLSPLVRLVRAVVMIAMAVVVFGVSWVLGETIKISSSGVDLSSSWNLLWQGVNQNSSFLGNYGYYVIGAVSHHYDSVLFTTHASRETLNAGYANPIVHPLQALAFRIDVLFGHIFDAPRPAYGSMSRLNYLLLTTQEVVSAREGSSAGPIGSFNYVFLFPLNVVLCAGYLAAVSRLTDRLLWAWRDRALSIVGLLLLLLSMLFFFESPLDLMVQLIDPATIHVLALVAVGLVAGSERSAVPEADGAFPFVPVRPVGGET